VALATGPNDKEEEEPNPFKTINFHNNMKLNILLIIFDQKFVN